MEQGGVDSARTFFRWLFLVLDLKFPNSLKLQKIKTRVYCIGSIFKVFLFILRIQRWSMWASILSKQKYFVRHCSTSRIWTRVRSCSAISFHVDTGLSVNNCARMIIKRWTGPIEPVSMGLLLPHFFRMLKVAGLVWLQSYDWSNEIRSELALMDQELSKNPKSSCHITCLKPAIIIK